MKCIYYLTSTLKSTSQIADDLHGAGIGDWFIHVLSKDEAGLSRKKIHSSNYLEQLDILRFGIMGAILGFIVGLFAVYLMKTIQPFGSDLPSIVYFGITAALTSFGAWEGGLIGIASENKKTALFHDEIESGKYLILIYARKAKEDVVKSVMDTKHPEAKLVAEDGYFYNPLVGLTRT
jgi:hypothetical protein